jgi:hypothetical protein
VGFPRLQAREDVKDDVQLVLSLDLELPHRPLEHLFMSMGKLLNMISDRL